MYQLRENISAMTSPIFASQFSPRLDKLADNGRPYRLAVGFLGFCVLPVGLSGRLLGLPLHEHLAGVCAICAFGQQVGPRSPPAVVLCPPRHAGLSAEEAKPSTPAPSVCQQDPGAPASPRTEILPPPSSSPPHLSTTALDGDMKGRDGSGARASHRVVPQREGAHPDR
ncbi:hypothetical protein L3Q82_023318 [Scortum barcoo]|uniref:Uncharacterized protein n=1 Tax=Scortum barcoo TaxID=214431 RepID=A0ACB8WYL2_9TELE|nr:hypothetical protein L3Q82_023318 [Scortum barcoo]